MAASVRLPRRGTLPLLLLLSFVSSLIHLASAADDADAPLNLPPPLIGQCSWSRYGYPTFAVRGGLDGLDTCPRPVSDTTAAALGGYGPWSYPPYCIRAPRNATTGALGLKYCVYTHLTFRGRGLSVISTPQMAANLVPALDDTRVPPRLRDGPASTMARRDAVRASGGRSYAIKTVPGRGKGLVARRRVPKWGEALVGFPIMVARTDFLEALDSEDRKRLEHRALAQLPKMAQEAILGLAHGAAGGSDDHGFLLEEIFRSNIFGIELAGVPHFALQVEGSRINHECRPNTFWRFSPVSLSHEVVAFREISMGEEFTHSYIALGLPHAQRRESLARWGFECHCPLCTASKNAAFASEVRRTRLIEIYGALESETAEGTLVRDKIDKLYNEMMLLINGEDLAPQLCEYYAVLARAYLSIDDFEDARYFAQQSEEYWIRYGTEDHENVDGVRELWQQIKEKEAAHAVRQRRQAAAREAKL